MSAAAGGAARWADGLGLSGQDIQIDLGENYGEMIDGFLGRDQ